MKCFPLLLLLLGPAFSQDFDLVIRNGRLVDGSGNPWVYADVGIREGRIAAVGRLQNVKAAEEIDAEGLVVAPGFIDIHNHSDDTILEDGNAESMVRQGVTSMIFGEGGSAAPLGGKQSRSRGGTAGWTDFDGYFARVLKQGVSTNIGTYVGSSQVWTYVRGEQAGPPAPEERRQMQDAVRTAMRQGALGVASSLSGPPGSWIDTATLIAMCKVAAEYGGIYSTHMRTEGHGIFESVAEALEIGRKASIPVDIIHLKIAENKLWGRMPELVATIQQARANGQQVEANVYPYRAGQNNLATILPPWVHEGGTKAMLARLQDPAQKPKIREQILNGIPGTDWYNHYTATGSWEGMLLVSLSNAEYKRFEGKRMNEVIETLGGDPIDVLFRLIENNNGSIPAIYFHHSEKDMQYALQQPFVSIGSDGSAVKTEGPLSRGNPHPRYYGTFPRVLGRYVRQEKVLTLEEAIRKMTSANASKLGIYDRGTIRPGAWADIAIFNPETIIDNSIWENPHQYATGVEYVVVNGELVLTKGEHTNARPGRILYGKGKEAKAKAQAAAPADRQAAEWVIRHGGSVRLMPGPLTARALADLPGTDFRVVAVDLIGTTIPPPELKNLSGLAELNELFLPGPIFNPGAGSRLDANEEFAALSGLKKLERLHISLHFLTNINVQDKGLAHLAGLTGMKELRLAQSRVKGPGLAPFTDLRKLDLNYSTFNDEGMPYLEKMKGLTHLSLRDTLVSDSGLQHIAGLNDLKALDLYGTRLTDEGVRHLAGLRKLENLNLLGASITDESLDTLAGLTELRELNLYRSQITNAGLSKLHNLKNLSALDLRYTNVTSGGVEEFRRAVPGAVIEFQASTPQVAGAELRQSKPAAETEQAIAEWVTAMGGKAAIRNGSVREVDLSRTPVSDAQIQFLRRLGSLEALSLESTEIGDLAASSIGALSKLRRLNLSHTGMADNGLAAIAKLAALEELQVSHSLVQGAGLVHVTAMSKLRKLSLAGCPIEDESVKHLAGAKDLQELDISYTDVTDAGLAHLKDLSALEKLDLTATEVSDPGLQHVAELTSLRELLMNYGRYTDKGVEHLARLTNLTRLEVARTRVSDASIPTLAKLPALKRLNLDYTTVSDKGLPQLATALPEIEDLRLDSADITDAAVETLARMKSLRRLNLYHTLVTDVGFERLQKALPECRIVYDRESALPTRRKS